MTRPVATVAVDQPLYEAIGFMRRQGLRHMPVVDARRRARRHALPARRARRRQRRPRRAHRPADPREHARGAARGQGGRGRARRGPVRRPRARARDPEPDLGHQQRHPSPRPGAQSGRHAGRRLGRAAGRLLRDRDGLGRARRELPVPRPGQRLHPRRLSGRRARADRPVLHRARRPHDRPARPARLPALPRRRDGDQPGVAQDRRAVAPAGDPLGRAAQRGRDAAVRRAVRFSERVRRGPTGG